MRRSRELKEKGGDQRVERERRKSRRGRMKLKSDRDDANERGDDSEHVKERGPTNQD